MLFIYGRSSVVYGLWITDGKSRSRVQSSEFEVSGLWIWVQGFSVKDSGFAIRDLVLHLKVYFPLRWTVSFQVERMIEDKGLRVQDCGFGVLR
jgi:hypothetical protein